jgi:hypothetical protein
MAIQISWIWAVRIDLGISLGTELEGYASYNLRSERRDRYSYTDCAILRVEGALQTQSPVDGANREKHTESSSVNFSHPVTSCHPSYMLSQILKDYGSRGPAASASKFRVVC